VSGLIVIPFLTFVGFLLALKKLGWYLYRNVFAIFFFCVFIVVYTNQADMATYAETALRTFPLLASLLWLLIRTHRLLAMPRERFRGSRGLRITGV
jgi:cytochrome b561